METLDAWSIRKPRNAIFRGLALSYPFLMLGFVSTQTVERFMLDEPMSIERFVALISVLMLVYFNWPELQKFWREGHPGR